MNRAVYLKKLGTRQGIALWLVNGSKIRRDLDIGFTNFGQHFRFAFIPENEFWLDKEATANERRFFIINLLCQWQMMKAGQSYEQACTIAGEQEKQARLKTEDLSHIFNKQGQIQLKRIHRRLLKKIPSRNLLVWLVYGRLVRSALNVDFTEGGHDLVYDFIPAGEVWLDNDVLAAERPFVLLHELAERSLMAKGLTYDQAHEKANQLESQCRRGQINVKQELAILGWR